MANEIILDIYACGWRLRAGIPLPGTVPWPALSPGRPDIAFVAADVPDVLEAPLVDVGAAQIAADGTALVRLRAGYFLIAGNRVRCDLSVSPDSPELVPIVFGNILACLGAQRGKLPLHGSAVAIDGAAVLLLGRTGAGKSALAAAIALAGHSVLADEVALVEDGACLPSGGPLQLADDVLAALGVAAEGLPQSVLFSVLAKRQWQGGPPPRPARYPISAVILLDKAGADPGAGPVLLDREEAEAAILNQLFWRDMLRVPSMEPDLRREAAALAVAAPVYRLPLPRDLGFLSRAATLVVRIGSVA